MTSQRIEAGLDASGNIVGWRHRVVGEPVGDFVYHPGYNKAAKDRDVIFMMGAELPYYNKVGQLALRAPDGARAHPRRRVARHRRRLHQVRDRGDDRRAGGTEQGRSARATAFRSPTTAARGACWRRWPRCRAGARSARGNAALGLAFAEYGALRAQVRLAHRLGGGNLGRPKNGAHPRAQLLGRGRRRARRSTRRRSPRRWKARSSGACAAR